MALRAIDATPDAFVATLPEASGASVLVLGGRPDPYALNDLAGRFPQVFTTLSDSSLLVTMPVVVGPGATLRINSATTPVVRFASGDSNYATLVAVDATVSVEGSAEARVTLTSYDPATELADEEIADGRSYVVSFGGRMQLDHTDSSALGFLLGESSGVAWMTRQGRSATGGALQSTFTNNYFGAYASGADGLVISGSSFMDNTVYGFDPHTGTTNTVIEDSQAARNGRHGFIFSAECDDNLIRNSQSYLNGGAGFVIDDGNDDAEEPLRPSNNNVLDGVSAANNRATGIVIEGGTGNSVLRSNLDGNPIGVWVKNAAAATAVADTSIARSEQAGIRLDAGTATTSVTETELSEAAVGVWVDGAEGTVLQNVSIDNSSKAAILLAGDPASTSFTNVTVTGTGDAAVEAPPTAESAEGTGLQVAGVDTSAWRTGDPVQASDLPYTTWLKTAPWLLIVAIPAALWVPFRWQWRRRQAARFGSAR